VSKTGKEKSEPAAERNERLAAELRANLKRRKARSRDALSGQASAAPVKKKPD